MLKDLPSVEFIPHDFQFVGGDTDSLFICNKDGSPMSEEFRISLLEELNSLYPEMIKFEADGYYPKYIVLRAKNYIMQDGNKIVYKGSAVKATQKEPALKEFIKEIIDAMLNDRTNYTEIYNKYVMEIMNVKDITRWSSKKTITDKILAPKRTNEQKVLNAIQGLEYSEGDKMYFFFLPDDSLCAVQRFAGEYNKEKLLEKLFKTTKLFENVIPIADNFVNYKLKRSQTLLQELVDSKTHTVV